MAKKNKKIKNRKRGRGTVFVGLSGGVDSSVSAGLLLELGYEVVGVFIKTWHPAFLECNEEEERRDAMRVAAHLGIPFLTFDFEEEYKNDVAMYMIEEYKKGRTPNPDVMCNKYIKFGAFFKKAVSMGADFVATGHYAQSIISTPLNKQFHLHRGLDQTKDQSYFLWTLTEEQLKKVLFPIGHLEKTKVRKIAQKFNLPVALKKDSQGVCFLGDIDLKDFLKHYIKEERGKVVNEKDEEIGYHEGVVFYTTGERRGFTIVKKSANDKPYYVIAKDIKKNILKVSQIKNEASTALYGESITLKNTNWISGIPEEGKDYTAQVRYHGENLGCKIKLKNKDEASIFFTKNVLVDSGQSVVVYYGGICLGGGVVI